METEHKCPQCGRPTFGTYSEGGTKWAVCEDCMQPSFGEAKREEAKNMEYHTLEEVVDAINSIYGIKESWEIAGEYAVDAYEPDAELTTKEILETHLEILEENGAKFDFEKAMGYALDVWHETYLPKDI